MTAFSATSVAAINAKVDQWWASAAAQNLFRQGQATVRVTLTGSGNYWNWNYTSQYGSKMSTTAYSSRQAAESAANSSANTLIRDALKRAQYIIEERSAWQAFQGICPASLLSLFSPPAKGAAVEAASEVAVKVKMNLEFKAKKSCKGCSSGTGLGTSLLVPAQSSGGKCSWTKSGKAKITYELDVESNGQLCSQLMQDIKDFVRTLNPEETAKKLKLRPSAEVRAAQAFDRFMQTLSKPTCNGPGSATGTSTQNLGTVKVKWQSFPVPP